MRDALSGELKEVTVLIADVAGSLAMAEALDPEDVHALMDGFFALALEAVHREGGTVNQFRGDGFMALFGAPRARGDDAARALRAALAVREHARAYAESVRARFALPFTIRMGVSTGRVWVGSIGNELRRDYTAEGPTVGLAARLENAAAPGQILVAETTARRCGAYFDLVELAPRVLRGLSEPVRTYELIGEGAHAARLSVERERGLTPFVGREADLAQLRLAIDAGHGVRCVEVRGEVGVGKSRLVHELARRLPQTVAVLGLAGSESGAQRAYRPWLGLLRHWPGDLPGAEKAGQLLARLEGTGGGSAPEPEEVAASVRALFEAVLAQRALLLVLDDAQWIDPSSQALIRKVGGQLGAGRLAFVATVRGDEGWDWGAPVPPTVLALDPLSAVESRRLAQAVLEDLPDAEALAELAWLRGGGNALFVEEVARALRDGAQALRDAARVEVSLARARERVPETLNGVVSARIDALPEAGKRLLEAAAVVGEPFPADLLRDVEPEAADAVETVLAELGARGLLARGAGGEYDFCHGVVRSGAYGQLVRERKGALHRRVAEALAKRPLAESADGASCIGHHYEMAGDAAAACEALQRAADGYIRLRALAEAVAHLRRAFGLAIRDGSNPQRTAAVGLRLATALGLQDRTGEAAAVLESVDVESAVAGDRLQLVVARVQTGWLRFSNDNEVARGRRLIERGLALAEDTPGSEDIQAAAHGYLSRIDLLDGALESSLAAARRACEIGSARGDVTFVAIGLHHENAAHFEAGRLEPARQAAERALFEVRGAKSQVAVSTAEVAVARLHYMEGNAAEAISRAQRGYDAGSRSGQLGLCFNAVALRGHALLLSGAVREARTAFESLIELNDRWPSTWLYVARGRLESGAFHEALEAASRSLLGTPPRGIRARALAVRGLALGLAGGAREEAELQLAEAIECCDRLGLRPALAEAYQFQAELAARRGDRKRAAHLARRAHDEFLQCGMRVHAEHAARAGEPRA